MQLYNNNYYAMSVIYEQCAQSSKLLYQEYWSYKHTQKTPNNNTYTTCNNNNSQVMK